jgi:hypothetical protein
MLMHETFIPDFLRTAALLAEHGGYFVIDRLPDRTTFEALRAEAWAAYATADRQDCESDDGEELRGGAPARRLYSAGAGPVQDAFYHDLAVRQALGDLCGVTVTPSGSRGSYSYYNTPGDYLALHRDIETCDVTFITCLHDDGDPRSVSGVLLVYPDRLEAPLSELRAQPAVGAVPVKLRAGQSVVLLGGIVPHQVLPAAPGQTRVISALCYVASPRCRPCEAAQMV